MNWSIRTRLLGFCGLGIALLVAVGGSGWWSLEQASHTGRTLRSSVRAVRGHLEMERLHDALRTDVAAALSAKSAAERHELALGLRRHASTLDRQLQDAARQPLDGASLATTADARAAFRRSVESAFAIAERLDRDDVAGAERVSPEFAQRWERAGAEAERTSERLEAAGTESARGMDQAAATGTRFTLAILAVAVLALTLAAQGVRRGVVLPLDQAVRVMDAMAGGDLQERVSLSRNDELGRLGTAVNRAGDSLGLALSRIADNAVAVGNASEELASVSNQLETSAKQTSEQMALASGASDQTNTSVRLVASSAQQVGQGIRDVAHNAHEAAAVAATAVRVAGEANATIRQLGESSEQIDNVIRVINSIAEQTNILALNAEIEAARAGEAGQGFAVVANEVKELAKETARATEDIAHRVSAIRSDSRAAVNAISEIGKIIDQISTTQSAIAASVQQQSAATAEITRNMGEAARGTDEIAATVGAVARSTENTSAAARETQRAASELAMMATELQRTVSQFRFGGRGRLGEDGPASRPRRALRRDAAGDLPQREAA